MSWGKTGITLTTNNSHSTSLGVFSAQEALSCFIRSMFTTGSHVVFRRKIMQLFYVACTIVKPTALSVFDLSPLSVQIAHIFLCSCVSSAHTDVCTIWHLRTKLTLPFRCVWRGGRHVSHSPKQISQDSTTGRAWSLS